MPETQPQHSYKNNEGELINSLSSEMDFQRLLMVLDKSKLWIAFFLFTAVMSALIYLRYTVPVFESSTILQIASNNTAQQVLSVENPFENKDISTEVEFLKSKFLLERTLSKLPLSVSYYNKGQFLSYELYKNSPFIVSHQITDSTFYNLPIHFTFSDENTVTVWYQRGKTITEKTFPIDAIQFPGAAFKIEVLNFSSIQEFQSQVKQQEFTFVVNSLSFLTDKYIRYVNVLLLNPSAQTVQISFRDNNASKARDIAAMLADEYKLYDVEKRSQSSRKILEFIDQQLDLAYNRLKVSESSMQQYKKTHNLSDVDQFSGLYLDKLTRFENEIIDVDLQYNVLNEIENKLQTGKKDTDIDALLPILAGTEYEASITSYIGPIKELYVKKQRILQETTRENDATKAIDQEIAVYRKLLVETITSLKQKLSSKKKDLLSKSGNIQHKFTNIPEKELEYARLQRMASIDEKFFSLLLEKKTEFSISEAGFVPQHTILEKAVIPGSPIAPRKNFILLTFFSVGIVLSIFFVIIRYLFYNTITAQGELESMLSSIPVLGSVPNYKKEMPVSQLIVNQNPKSLIAESFRNIRSNLQFISTFDKPHILAVTSTISGEGKTFIAINLAGIYAFSGKKVIVLDLDMRKPKIHLGFGVENKVGMSSILSGNARYTECVCQSAQENLHFITAGPIPPNPSELILNGNMDGLLADLKNTYDLIIIDNPPVGLVTDGLSVLQKADYPIYVFRAGYSKRAFVKNALRVYSQNKIMNLSAVINGVDINKSYYGKGYNYGYNTVYANEYYIDDTQVKKGFFARLVGK